MLGIIAIFIFLLMVLSVGLFRPNRLFLFYAGSLPFFGVIAELGIQVTPYHVVSAVMGISIIFQGATIRLPNRLLPFLLYAIAITIVMAFFLPDSIYQFPPLRGRFRWISQLVVITLLFLPIIFAVNAKVKADDIRRIMAVFLAMAALLCITGILQLVVFHSSGNDPFPINMFSGFAEKEEFRSGLSRINVRDKVLRMSGLGGGEPKHFGYTAVMGFVLNALIWIVRPANGRFGGGWHVALAVLFGASVLLSLSTQAYLVLSLNVLLITSWMLIKRGVLNKRTLLLLALLAFAGVFLVINDYSRRLLELRIYERLSETGAVEDFNQTILRFLRANTEFIPFGTGLGNIHFWASEYIPKEFGYFMRNSVFVAKAGFLRLISELGVIGLFLFLFGYAGYGYLSLRRNRFEGIGWNNVALGFMALVVASFMISSDASPFYVFSLMLVILGLRSSRGNLSEVSA